MKKLLITLILSGSLSSYAIVNGSSGTIKNHPLSVVGINANGRCTATKVGENLYLTARHCLLDSQIELNDEGPLILVGNYFEQRIVISQNIKGLSSNFEIVADIKEIFLRSSTKVASYVEGSIYLEVNSNQITNDVAFFTLHESDKNLNKLPTSEFDFDYLKKDDEILLAGYGNTECNNNSYFSLPYTIKVAKQTVERSQNGIFSSTGSKSKPYVAGGDSGGAVFRVSTNKSDNKLKIIGVVSVSNTGTYIPFVQSYKERCFPQSGFVDLTEQESFINDVLEKRIEPAVRFDREI
jgi:hypothetical protein